MKKISIFGFILMGIILGVLVIYISEYFGFSHANVLPFGGKSWALWVYPLSFSLSFIIAAYIFKIKEKTKLFISLIFVTFFLFFMIMGTNLFNNFLPFGK